MVASFRLSSIIILNVCGSLLVAATYCGEKQTDTANEYMHSSKFEELTQRFEDPARDEWQRPTAVLNLLGDLAGRQVADLGAGTGYFSERLTRAGARVISLDVDDRFLEYLRKRKQQAGALPNVASWEIRKTGMDRPQLAPEEVDLILLANVYHHIENRTPYFRAARAGLKPGGRLVVVDFKLKGDHPVGPPAAHRVGANQARDELKAAGYQSIKIDTTSLPYQYVLIAAK